MRDLRGAAGRCEFLANGRGGVTLCVTCDEVGEAAR